MSLITEIKQFHSKWNVNLHKQPLSALAAHGIKVEENTTNKTQLKIRAFHYTILSAKRKSIRITNQYSPSSDWEEIREPFFYYERELQEFALQCLYLTNTILGECIVQRSAKKQLQVIYLKSLAIEDLLEEERVTLAQDLEKNKQISSEITFGTDLEIMFFNQQTKKYIDASMLINEKIGFDAAIALHQHRVFHPIIEVRPEPAHNMSELNSHLRCLYDRLKKETNKYNIEIVSTPNPVGRFFLGGHLHFGNVPVTFHHVRLLDCFLTIPFAIKERNPSLERRKSYGRLGSVKKNKFSGFEYRVLPTWFKRIPHCLPMLLWSEYLLHYGQKLYTPFLEECFVTSYYHPKQNNDELFTKWEEQYGPFIKDDYGKQLLNNYITYLKNYEIVENPI